MKNKTHLLELNLIFKANLETNLELAMKNFETLDLTAKVIFKEEEELYFKHDHPEAKMHKAIHDEFSRVIAYFAHMFFSDKNKKENIKQKSELVFEYINKWINDHDLIQDKNMMPFINISQFIGDYANT